MNTKQTAEFRTEVLNNPDSARARIIAEREKAVTDSGKAPGVLKKWDRVIVRNKSISGRDCIEGNATVIKYTGNGRYRVNFDGDPKDETYERFINPADKL